MKTKSGVAQNDEVNQRTENSDIPEMSEIDKAACEKIQQMPDATLHQAAIVISGRPETFRLQPGEHGGSNVFFNRDGHDRRYSLSDGMNGSMYLADSPLTAMKEVFQGIKGLKESDLARYYMGTVVIEKDIKVVDVTALVRHSSLTLHEVTTADRRVTQFLAQKIHAAGFDGMAFLSNVAGERCLVIWHHDPSGQGMATTRSQTCLTDFEIDGQEAADILVYQLGIPVDE
ncbi:RES family NAD+ phosphorylase [Pectobacterium carotovorum subsp. carotovorum]|uniref:RES family NAD+ phosphorylase n=1 Tax=Pectobacterium TaxID=122277 RepID=UPI001373C4B3|nr:MULTISPECIES: RES family NAD+ phosphorylase [Pectobacterium]QHP82790.1 RES domain-containing protein [Pectobacterium odoriferum]WDF99832.1 RES family NAD+ phosphorylase [Pectobacterium carotovorum subsp. carotovorum]